MKCNKCGQEYDGGVCPNCGTSAPGKSDVPKKKKKFRWWYILIVIVVIGVIGALGGGDESGPTDPSGQQPESQQDAAPDEGESVESIAPAESEPPASNLTTGQKDALEQAASYLSFSAFSRDGLAGQLEYEGFTAEEAAFAADNCGAD